MKEKYKIQHSEIIAGLKRGDRKSQFEIYKLYYKAMYNTVLRIVNNSLEAEDIMQDAFLSAFSKIETYKEEVSFGAWLKKIVINKSFDFLKKKKIQFDEINENFIDHENEISSEKTIKFKVELIKEAMTKLPDNHRIILSLYLLEGYDHNEIAEILGIRASSSRSQLTRAKKKLISSIES